MGRIHLGTILGTAIGIDVSFFFLVAFFIITSLDTYGMPAALLWAPVIFISVLWHELAHAAMIGILGHGSSEIVLGGFGGVTISQRDSRPWQNVLISAAGPASSLFLGWLVTILWMNVPYLQHDRFFRELGPLLRWANIAWGFLNLLPVIPLDGSSVVRNLLRMFTREQTAFVVSVWLSMLTAAAVIVWALIGRDWFLAMLIGWMLFTSWQRWEFYRQTNRTDI